jgi:hypothetical protein
MHAFGRPRGVLGKLGGIIMARTNADFGTWTSNLLGVKKLVVVPEDAKAVRTIFRRCLALGSLGMLIDDLDRLGIKPRNSKFGRFMMGPLAHVLKNRADMPDERADGRPQSASLLTIPWVPVGAKPRKGIAFEPVGDQNLDPFARPTLLTVIARARCWMDDPVEGRVSLSGDRQKRGQG